MQIRLLLLVFIVSACNQNRNSAGRNFPENQIDYHVYQLPEGWGYSIYKDKKLFIRQEIIPVIQGSTPFRSESDATLVAQCVIKKLKSGASPRISARELQLLHIRF